MTRRVERTLVADNSRLAPSSSAARRLCARRCGGCGGQRRTRELKRGQDERRRRLRVPQPAAELASTRVEEDCRELRGGARRHKVDVEHKDQLGGSAPA